MPLLVVVGAGPGVSGSVARRFAREGYAAALLGVDPEALEQLADQVRALGVEATTAGVDVTDVDALTREITAVGEAAGSIDVLHFNPSAYREADPLHLDVAGLLEDVALGVGAL